MLAWLVVLVPMPSSTDVAARFSGERYASEKALLADRLRTTFPRRER